MAHQDFEETTLWSSSAQQPREAALSGAWTANNLEKPNNSQARITEIPEKILFSATCTAKNPTEHTPLEHVRQKTQQRDKNSELYNIGNQKPPDSIFSGS